ncbi:unnamed protein product, partial [Ascophyllum nodosum]
MLARLPIKVRCYVGSHRRFPSTTPHHFLRATGQGAAFRCLDTRKRCHAVGKVLTKLGARLRGYFFLPGVRCAMVRSISVRDIRNIIIRMRPLKRSRAFSAFWKLVNRVTFYESVRWSFSILR